MKPPNYPYLNESLTKSICVYNCLSNSNSVSPYKSIHEVVVIGWAEIVNSGLFFLFITFLKFNLVFSNTTFLQDSPFILVWKEILQLSVQIEDKNVFLLLLSLHFDYHLVLFWVDVLVYVGLMAILKYLAD